MRWWITTTALFLALAIAWHGLGATAWAQSESGVTLSAVAASQDGSDDGPDVALLSYVTLGSFLGAAAIALVLYLVRTRLGFWLHRPPPPEEGAGPQHH